jgi:hypothetical protein
MHFFGDEPERSSSGPGAADWLAGLVRGFHPLRLLLSLVGLVLTGSSLVVAKACFDRAPPDFPSWWQDPIEHAQALRDDILGGSAGRAVVCGALLLVLNIMLWCLIGGCLARHELVARLSGRHDTPEGPGQPSTVAFVLGWWKTLLTCYPVLLLLVFFFLIPMGVAILVNTWCGGFGAVILAVLLPVVLVVALFLLVFGFGSLAWPLMPVAVAAECSDQFDALSRGVNYPCQRPISFLLLTATAVGLAGLPLGALTLLAEQMRDWQPWARQTVVLFGAGLAASLFWSLQTLVYLHLRWAIDGVDAGAVADGPPPNVSSKPPSPGSASAEPAPEGETRPAGAWSRLRGEILPRGAVIASWCLTYWLLASFSSGPEWLGWGLSGNLIPPVEGAYRVASVIAGVWLLVLLVMPGVLARFHRRGAAVPPDEKAQEPS